MTDAITSRWRMLPNLISVGRLLTVPMLVWISLKAESGVFIGVVVVAWLSDGLDGWLARRFGWTSRVGAVLDSVADVALICVTLFGIDQYHPFVFREHGAILVVVLAAWTCVHASAFSRYRRMASFHTGLARTGIVLYVVFVLALFTVGFVPWLYYLCGAVCLIAGLENLALVWLVRDWNPDFKGGLLAALRRSRSPSE